MPPSPRARESTRKEDSCTASEIVIEDDCLRHDEEMSALGTLPETMTSGIPDDVLRKQHLPLEERATHGEKGLVEKVNPNLLIFLRILLTQPMVRQTVLCCDAI